MKYMPKMLETCTSRISETPASAPAYTATQKKFAVVVNSTQLIFVRSSDADVVVASKDEMIMHANKQPNKGL